MKTHILILISIFSLEICSAQTLKVTYTERVDLSESLSQIDNPAIKKMVMEKTGTPKRFELISSNGISLYKKEEKQDYNQNVTIMGAGGSEDIIYKNHKKNEFVNQTDFMSRTFLIQDKLSKLNWKITDETQKIGNYSCRKAVLKRGDNNIIAWFTDEISSNDGPREYYGLPGLILKVKTKSIIIEATNISVSKEKADIKKPTKGKKVTREEFERIKEEKLNNLTGGQKNNGVQIIKM